MLGTLLKNRLMRRIRKSPPVDPRSELERRLPDALPAEVDLILETQSTTMTSPERIVGLIRAIDYVSQQHIPGDIVECGVWRGGSMYAAAKSLLRHNDVDRRLWLYDTFGGMSEPTSVDIDLCGRTADELMRRDDPADRFGVWCISRLEEVRRTIASSGYSLEKVNFIAGPVEETLPKERPSKIALLRLDTDWYQSTRCELEHLFPLLVDGGVLIIDDYGHWQGCREAVDEYFHNHDVQMHLVRLDYTGRIGIKMAARPVAMSFREDVR
jgi:hypothetical protein